jgi:DNA repair protein RecN (Recombination protein N)
MLEELTVVNLAVVEEARIRFGPGLNVLTGETGAGKSILVGAVDLLVGARAGAEWIRKGSTRATVEGVFRPAGDALERARVLLGEDAEEIALRREIGSDGRSRAFVNGRAAAVTLLRDLGRKLVDLHGQHEHQALLDPSTHVDVLDRHAGLGGKVAEYRELRSGIGEARREVERLRALLARREERLDALSYQIREIEEARLEAGEEETLRAERAIGRNASRIASHYEAVVSALEGDEDSAASRLGKAARALGQAAEFDGEASALAEEAGALEDQVRAVARTVAGRLERMDVDPDRLAWVEERLVLIERLRRKHAADLAGILARLPDLIREREDLERTETAIAEAGRVAEEAERRVREAAMALSSKRAKAGQELAKRAATELASLAMEGARLEIRMARVPDPEGIDVGEGEPVRLLEDGIDRVEFFLRANEGEDARSLAKTASGGEISRVMLALKTVLSRMDPADLLVFDEIDAGIGGATAAAVAERLQAIARKRQVIAITHLPVIAARADHHFRVEKETARGRTRVHVRDLPAEERVEEIARMLAGDDVSDITRRHARELLATP